jgi:hypothetical protein
VLLGRNLRRKIQSKVLVMRDGLHIGGDTIGECLRIGDRRIVACARRQHCPRTVR